MSKQHPLSDQLLTDIQWNADGLIPAIAQDAASGKVLMMAWMNGEAVRKTLESGQAVYWSRSRQRLWLKGESSGHIQKIIDIRLDCDGDTLLLLVEQLGGIACHTGRESCMFKSYSNVPAGSDTGWLEVEPVLKDPSDIY